MELQNNVSSFHKLHLKEEKRIFHTINAKLLSHILNLALHQICSRNRNGINKIKKYIIYRCNSKHSTLMFNIVMLDQTLLHHVLDNVGF